MTKVGIGHTQQLTLKDVKWSPLGELESVVMSVRMQGLTAHRQIAAHYGTGHEELSSFFNDLAEPWSGWQGIKSYRSLERDLQLEATHGQPRQPHL
ncbi:hypothetical protein BMF89_16775 [Arthrobacter sp. SRS-W-1-2016]|uniref:DUF6228 family protein n=1 Tax=Arthrobacter sp. SRS-W-1-2016 TaxID=1930254 RepID=UPI0009911ECC|nr:DUF6228 family protein [Arthrobacter sp. SRS-W-1-2016]OOP60390.1 hypothetical protein BMF89_16775 [Arthrobacter sp. SRS-W-1-2016]